LQANSLQGFIGKNSQKQAVRQKEWLRITPNGEKSSSFNCPCDNEIPLYLFDGFLWNSTSFTV